MLRGDGRWLRVEGVETRSGRRTVYNLEVEGWHTYIVGELGAWVHNTCPEFVFRQLSAADRAALDAGNALVPKGVSGTIAEHVAGNETGHISASLTKAASKMYASGNGVAMIKVSEAIKNGAKFITHKNVLEAVKMAGDAKSLKYAKDSLEVLFKGEIPASAVVKILPR